jgi:hypothetical protein
MTIPPQQVALINQSTAHGTALIFSLHQLH